MKLKVLQENLHKALTNASRFVSPRAQLPVLGNILFKASKTKLLISSTNLETSISTFVGAQTEEEGEITVPAKVVVETVGNLLPGSVSLESEKEQLEIKSQGSALKISGMNTSDFPAVPQKIETNARLLPKEPFLEALSQVIFATSADETRPVLTGVLFLFKKGLLTLVSTDGFRLSQKRIPLKGVGASQKTILPKTVLIETSRLATGEDEILFSYKENENQAAFGFTDTVLSSRVLEGEFPDFEKIIPSKHTLKVEVDKEDFLRAIKLAAVFARDSANIVRLSIKKGSINVLAESSQSGSQETEIEASVEGEAMEISFNYRFLEELLGVIRGETVGVALSSPNSPGVFTDPKDESFLHLIMPVKVQG